MSLEISQNSWINYKQSTREADFISVHRGGILGRTRQDALPSHMRGLIVDRWICVLLHSFSVRVLTNKQEKENVSEFEGD